MIGGPTGDQKIGPTEVVVGTMPTIDSRPVLDLLAGLVDKSLVVYEEQPDGTARYRLLESTREYAP